MIHKKLTALTGSGQTHPEASIQVKRFPAVEFHGQRVVRFAMIDEVHRRPKDTAKKNFQRYPRRLSGWWALMVSVSICLSSRVPARPPPPILRAACGVNRMLCG